MGGAYTAVPAATPDPPDVPPGWGGPDIPGSGGPGGTSPPGTLGGIGYWPFPPPGLYGGGRGPFPPGYNPDYSFNTTVPVSTAYDAAISVSTQLRDRTDYTTGNPGGSSLVAWSATVNGELRRIRFDGVGSYASSVDSSYASAAGFWGAAPTLDIELTEDDNGEDLVLALTSEVGIFNVIDSQTISIGIITARITVTWVYSNRTPAGGGDFVWNIETDIKIASTTDPSEHLRFDRSVSYYSYEDDVVVENIYNLIETEATITAPAHPARSVIFDLDELRDGETYRLSASSPQILNVADCDCTWIFVVETFFGGNLLNTDAKQVTVYKIDSPSYFRGDLADIDADTGDITIL